MKTASAENHITEYSGAVPVRISGRARCDQAIDSEIAKTFKRNAEEKIPPSEVPV